MNSKKIIILSSIIILLLGIIIGVCSSIIYNRVNHDYYKIKAYNHHHIGKKKERHHRYKHHKKRRRFVKSKKYLKKKLFKYIKYDEKQEVLIDSIVSKYYEKFNIMDSTVLNIIDEMNNDILLILDDEQKNKFRKKIEKYNKRIMR